MTNVRLCLCAYALELLTFVYLCVGLHITPSKNNFALLHKLFEISGHICTVCNGAVCSQSIREI